MNSQTPADHDISRSVVVIVGVLAAGAITAAIGLLALVGWVLGPPVLAGFGAGLIPMAPSTAVLFLLYGEAICVRARPPLGRRAFRTSVAAACVGMLVALVLFALSYLGINWAGEHAGASITGTIGGAPIGHMSPVTAFCFLVASVSFLASLSRLSAAPTRWRAVLALGLAGVLLGMCFVFLLAYLFGAPLLYGGRYIPPALNTILAFTTLGVALLALAGWPAGQSDESRPSGFRTALTLVSILVLLSAGIVATGYIYYRNYEQRYRAEVERQLSVIADLKVGQLEQYRKERLGDGAVLHRNASFSDLVRRFLGRPEDANAHQQLRAWIGAYQSHYQYDRVFLLDATGVLRMSAPDSSQAVTSVLMARVPEILRSNQVIFQDFYRHEQDQRVYLSVLVPLRDEAAGDRPLGVLVLRIDPATYVYPFISRWPTPNRTAETLLVRKEGNDAVFLNELRFQTNTALNLRSPLSRATMPAVQAALGRQGITEGLDYRGVPVVAALRTVPNSPWALVARMDTAEVYAPLRERLWLTVLLMGALVLGAGASLGLVWREQSVRFYKGQAHAAEALSKSEHRYRTLFDAIDEGFCIVAVIFDEHDKSIDYRFLEINPSFEKQTGLIDALGKRMRDLAPKHEEHWFAIYGKIALTGQPARFVNVRLPCRPAGRPPRRHPV
ncbi:MAG: PAS domain-containing protein [Acidobacteria bacterium]|nr:PAS domain-containing protein [Acidobacteriota bacterium]